MPSPEVRPTMAPMATFTRLTQFGSCHLAADLQKRRSGGPEGARFGYVFNFGSGAPVSKSEEDTDATLLQLEERECSRSGAIPVVPVLCVC